MEVLNSFLDITRQLREMEPRAKKLRKAIGASAAAIGPSGGSEIFYNQTSETGFSRAEHMWLSSSRPLSLSLWETLEQPLPRSEDNCALGLGCIELGTLGSSVVFVLGLFLCDPEALVLSAAL